jgi:hypothetical protein
LVAGYEIVQAVLLGDQQREQLAVLVCSCEDGVATREKVSTLRRLSRPIGQPVLYQEEHLLTECIHGTVVRRLCPQLLQVPAEQPEETIELENDDSTFNELQPAPLTYAVKCAAGTYGIVVKGTSHWRCHSCNRTNCSHTAALKGYGGLKEDDVRFQKPSTSVVPVKSVSYLRIPFPLKNVSEANQLPAVFVSDVNETCCHGNDWSKEDALDKGWIRQKGSQLQVCSVKLYSF